MADEMTIDELARRSETTTRNVRAYQTRGLLPPPRVVGRVGYYDEGHLARLKYIAQLQRRGFSLAAIHDLLAAWEQGRSLSDVLEFEGELTTPWVEEKPEIMSRARLEKLFPEIVDDPGLLQRAIDLGIVVPEGDDFKAISPRQIEIGVELTACGIPLSAVLDEHEKLAANLESIAERFVRVFEKHVWEPFVAEGLPGERLGEITETMRRMRPVASLAVEILLAQSMERQVNASTARQVEWMQRLMQGAEPSRAS